MTGIIAPSFTQQINRAFLDTTDTRIWLLTEHDTLGSVPLDKHFKTLLVHEKKRKKRNSVVYRLAQYASPTQVEAIPVIVPNTSLLLHVKGLLTGDVSTRFETLLYSQNGQLRMETYVKDISVNLVSFRIIPYMQKQVQVISTGNDSIFAVKMKKNYVTVAHHEDVHPLISFTP